MPAGWPGLGLSGGSTVLLYPCHEGRPVRYAVQALELLAAPSMVSVGPSSSYGGIKMLESLVQASQRRPGRGCQVVEVAGQVALHGEDLPVQVRSQPGSSRLEGDLPISARCAP